MKQEATHQVNKIERMTHTIARKVAVPRREHRQPEYKGCSYDLVGGTKRHSQPKKNLTMKVQGTKGSSCARICVLSGEPKIPLWLFGHCNPIALTLVATAIVAVWR